MIANFAEDEKRGFFLRVVGTGLLFFLLGLFFLLLYLEKELVLSPLFLFMGCFRKFLSAVQVLA